MGGTPVLPKIFASCARRRRRLAPLARDVVLARGDGRPLAPAAWAAILAFLYFTIDPVSSGVIAPASAVLFVALALIAIFDACYLIIPDGPIWLLAAVGLATLLIQDPADIPSRLAAAAAGYAALRSVAVLYERWRSVAGLGQGDARLFAIAGLWLGLVGLPSCLIVAVFSALVAAVLAARSGSLRDPSEPIPFGPHLALGIWLVWTVGPIEIG